MSMSKKWLNFCYDMAMYIIIAVFVTFCVWLLMSCSPKVITVPEYHYERHNTTDTVMMRDSILREHNTIIREADSSMLADLGIRLQQGERAILVLRKELERALNQQREVVHDTIVKVDSIRVAYPVEKQLTKWEKLKMEAGGWVFVVLAVLLIYLLFRIKKP